MTLHRRVSDESFDTTSCRRSVIKAPYLMTARRALHSLLDKWMMQMRSDLLPCLKKGGKGSSREEPEIGTEVVMRNALLFIFFRCAGETENTQEKESTNLESSALY